MSDIEQRQAAITAARDRIEAEDAKRKAAQLKSVHEEKDRKARELAALQLQLATDLLSTLETAAALQKMQFADIRFVVPRYLVEGLSILGGKPKIGKSWWALDAALAVAAGGICFGQLCLPVGDVLYLALEDNRRRLQKRIGKVLGKDREWPARFEYSTEWPRSDEGGLEKIKAWVKSKPNARLIVVDVLAAFRSARSAGQAAYDGDYNTVKALQQVASEVPGLAILVIHHLRKGAAETDAFDKLSGTLGLSGAADSVLILDRDGQGTTLYARGRDIEELESAVEFDREACRWKVLGDAAEVRVSDSRSKILAVLQAAARPMKATEVGTATEMGPGTVRSLLFRMAKDGQIRNDAGKYSVALKVDFSELPLPTGHFRTEDGRIISAPPIFPPPLMKQ